MLRRCARRLAYEPAGQGFTAWNPDDIAEQARAARRARDGTERAKRNGSNEVAALLAEAERRRLKKQFSFDGLTITGGAEGIAIEKRIEQRLNELGRGDPNAPDAPVHVKLSAMPSLPDRAAKLVNEVKRATVKVDRRDPYGFSSRWPAVRNAGIFLAILLCLRHVLASVAPPKTIARSRRPADPEKRDPDTGVDLNREPEEQARHRLRFAHAVSAVPPVPST